MKTEIIKEFQNPGNQYRGAPFWAWNGSLDPEELRRQIRLMHRMGLGGFFMHSRVGLNTAYLSKAWFDGVNACVDEAKKLKMRAWMYDEDRWPSGAAGGLVTKNPKYRLRSLVMNAAIAPEKFAWQPDMLAAFTARVDEKAAPNQASDIRPLARGKKPGRLPDGYVVLSYRVQLDTPSSWFNGQTYLDTMNPAAVREYIRVTHEAYRKHAGKEFGQTIPGMFTDEPHRGRISSKTPDSRNQHPWTDRLPAVFRKRYGYDILKMLPHLFFQVDGNPVSKIRYHYNDCLTHMFVDAFARQIGEWCERNHLMFTGHVLEEDTLTRQTTMVGSCMRFYEHMQAPGMDLLTEHWRIYDTAKQVSSAARQFGRKWRLTETYGCTGWDFPFAGHKALGDWQTALGINLRCQHLAWYTMEGEAKRDYPAGIFYQSPWWELYPKVEDYFARVYSVMTRGTEVRDLLVIHPVESIWLMTCKNMNFACAEAAEMNRMLVALRDSLLTEGVDFDYGDEELMSRHAAIVKRKGETLLRVGKAFYKSVVVPPQKTIRATTLRLLARFQQDGGQVVFAGAPPALLDAAPSAAVAEFATRCTRAPASGPALARAVAARARRISIIDEHGGNIPSALHLLREDAENFYLFVCNSSHTRKQLSADIFKDCLVRDRKNAFAEVRIKGFAECAGRPLELDPDTGAIHAAAAVKKGGKWELQTSLPAIGSRLFVIPKRQQGKVPPPRPQLKTVRTATMGGKSWHIRLSEANALVLDRAQYRIGHGKWEKADEILRIDRCVRAAMGVPHRGGAMVQPWAQQPPDEPRRATVALKYCFDVQTLPSGELFLALEQPLTFQIAINGSPVSVEAESGWWCDRSLRKLPLDGRLLRLGRNELVMTCHYTDRHPGLEIVYLLGQFGAAVRGTAVAITRAPTTLRIGDWVLQGLAFYSGSVAYCRTITPKLRAGERLFVQAPAYRGVAVRLLVNGRSAGIMAWEPNELDITDLLTDGPNQLAIEVIGHRRNSHGPFHFAEKWPTWTGPEQYASKNENWIDGYQLVPCGLMQPPKLTVKKCN